MVVASWLDGCFVVVAGGRCFHQLPLRAQPSGGSWPGVQPWRARGGVHEFSVDFGACGDMGLVRRSSGVFGALAVSGFHRRHIECCAVPSCADAVSASSRSCRLDVAGADLQQRDIRGVDICRRLGNAAVHVFHCRGGGASVGSSRQPHRASVRVFHTRSRFADASGGSADSWLLHRMVRVTEEYDRRV